MSSKPTDSVFRDQLAGVVVQQLNLVRESSRLEALDLNAQLLEKALEQVDDVRAWLLDPSTLLGSEKTKHGEVAELIEVGIRNARSILDGLDPPATFEGAGRTDAVDYFINGQAFQSKFHNGIASGLRAFVEHMEKYPDHAQNGGYMFPSDRYEMVMEVLRRQQDGLEIKGDKSILEWIGKIEELTGRKFEDAVQPSVSSYAEVQLGVAHDTLDSHEIDLEERNAEHTERIETEHAPSLAGAAQAAAIAGTVSGVLTTGMAIYTKAQNGKNLFRGEFTAQDWKDVGLAGGKGFAGGAVTGAAIYGMTNYAGMAAPLAASVVSVAKGMTALTLEYRAGQIGGDEFLDLGMCLCAESAVVGLATVAGQTLIPIPVLGGVLGSISGKMMLQLAQGLDDRELEALRAEMNDFTSSLDETCQRVIEEITAEFDKLGALTDAAFNIELNRGLMLCTSVDLAVAHGVAEEKILRTISDVDGFMLG